ncbi:MAG: NAD(P)/FAD-dependent oxidoreductase [Burkholderiales bacterium]
MNTEEIVWPRSLWAAVTPEGPALPSVQGALKADVVVIGAGFTGLSTALHLRKAGVDVAVVEAMEPGWGASGSNNGQVIPTLSRVDPDELIKRYGAAGERFAGLIRDSAALLFDTVREHGIAAEAEQTGWIQPVHTPGRMKIAERRVAQWSRLGAPAELLSAARMRELLGSDAWHGGWWNPTGGHINPLALARGLAQAVIDTGGRIYARSPALRYAREGGRWVVHTPMGVFSARALVLASNAYTGEFSKALAPRIARELIPAFSWQMATQPLPDAVRRSVLPGRQAMSDTHGELYFCRYDARHRLVTGGALIAPFDKARRMKQMIAKRIVRLFPQIGEVAFDYVWNGYIGMTPDYTPRFHRLGPDAYAWAGCNGRGVALALAAGRELAKAVRGTAEGELALPFTQPTPIPLQGIVRELSPLMLLVYRYRDGREVG